MRLTRHWTPEGRFLFDLFRLVCHGLVIMVFLGFLGDFVPIGDSLAVFRYELTVLLAIAGVIAFALGRTFIPMIVTVMVVLSGAGMAAYLGSEPLEDAPHLTLHQHNFYFKNEQPQTLVANILDLDADLLALQEVGPHNIGYYRVLMDNYVHYEVCHYGYHGAGVMARDMGPRLDGGCGDTAKFAWMQIETGRGPITLVSIHQRWPWPLGQFWQSDAYEEELSYLPQPVILAGDFNMVPWGASVHNIAQAVSGRVVDGLAPTIHLLGRFLSLRIDNVIVPDGAKAHVVTTPKWGSDHNGLTAEIILSAQ